MALIDTNTLSIAVDRSILGPQGRRWIENKLPEVASSLSFVAVSGFGACLLMYQVCRDYSQEGLRYGLFQLPKHIANAIVLHLVARMLRWHVTRLVTVSFFPEHGKTMFPFSSASPRGNDGGSTPSAINFSWPWQQSTGRARESSPSDSESPVPSPGLRGAAPPDPSAEGGAAEQLTRGSRENSSGQPLPPPSPEQVENDETASEAEGKETTTAVVAAVEKKTPEHTSAAAAAQAATGEASAAGGGSSSGSGGSGVLGFAEAAQGVTRLVTQRTRSRRSNRSSRGRSQYFMEEHASELAEGGCFFMKMVDDDSWLFVEEELYQPEWGWAIRPFHRGYKVSVRYPGEVGKADFQRLLFQCEPGKHAGCYRIRCRGTNTYLFFLGLKRPLTLCSWDREVMGGDLEDFYVSWLTGSNEQGRVVLRGWSTRAYVQWTGDRFIHAGSRETATRFMLQRNIER